MRDSYGDGLCCGQGDGYYKVSYRGKTIRESVFKNKDVEWSGKFGKCTIFD